MQPVHLFRVRHRMDSQSSSKLLTLLFVWIKVFAQLIMVVVETLRQKEERLEFKVAETAVKYE